MRTRTVLMTAVIAALSILMLGTYGLLTAEEYNPDEFEVILHRTDLYTSLSDSTPETVFDAMGAGVTVDLVTNPGDVFGEGEVAVGTYQRMRLTLGNLVSVAGTEPCKNLPGYAGTFRIDDGLPPDAQVQVYFATAGDGGNSMVTAEGTPGDPFLMQSPIIVENGETTVVRLAFYTSGSLVCIGGTDVRLRPPTVMVASYIEGAEPVVNPAGEYWLAHFNVNAHLFDEQTGDWFDPSTSMYPDEVLNRMGASTGWGGITMYAPDASTGIGSWRIEDASWRDGGFGEHRHDFARWTDLAGDGYVDTAPNLPMEGTYLITGNHIFISMSGGTAMEGYVADDGNSLVLVNIGGVDDSDVVFAVKKAADFPADITSGTYVIVSPQLGFRYDTSGAPPYPAAEMDLSGELIVIQGDEDNFFSWGMQMSLIYSYTGPTITGVYGRAPEERADEQSGISAMLAFDSSGFATTSPEQNTMFLAMGGDDALGYLGLFAGLGAETGVDDNEHRLTNGFIVEADPEPTLAKLTGRWALMGVNWEGNEGGGGWDTGDEDYEMLVTYGILDIEDTGAITWTFTNKDIITQAIEYDAGSGSVAATTEYYGVGNPIGNPDPGAIPLPLFTINSPAGSSTVVARVVMDRRGNTAVFWSPLDEGGIPQDDSTVDTANNLAMGTAVRIQ